VTSPSPRIITVLSGKGGVGKSNIAVNLALALCQRGRRVLLWDMDLGLANVDIILNLNVRSDLSHVLSGKKGLAEIIIEGPEKLHVIPGASGDAKLANLNEKERDNLLRELGQIQPLYDFIIIDTGAGISDNTIQFASTADEALMVTTPEPTAMLDAYATIKLLNKRAPWTHIHLVVNMARNLREAQNTLFRMSAIAEEYLGSHLENDGFILFDEAVGNAVRHRQPYLLLYPNSKAAESTRTIARLIEEMPAPETVARPPAGKESFIQRLFHHIGKQGQE
jgi:flagellar biosynthesis protein FlhG